jgi:hypothetical protein
MTPSEKLTRCCCTDQFRSQKLASGDPVLVVRPEDLDNHIEVRRKLIHGTVKERFADPPPPRARAHTQPPDDRSADAAAEQYSPST